MKKQLYPILLCIAVLCLTGCSTAPEADSKQESETSAVIENTEASTLESLPDSSSPETDNAPETEAATNVQNTVSPEEIYQDILDKFYIGVSGGWQPEPETGYGIQGITADSISYLWVQYSDTYTPSNVGYQFTDLNADGISELIIAPVEEFDDEHMFYELYTYYNQKVIHLVSSGERDRFGIDKDGLIAEFASGSAMDYGVWCYKIYDGILNCCETYQSDGTLGSFLYGDSSDGTADVSISKEEYDSGIAAHAHVPLQLIPFSSYSNADILPSVTEAATDAPAVQDPAKACGDNTFWDFDETTGTLTISGTGAVTSSKWIESLGTDENGYSAINRIVVEEGVTELHDSPGVGINLKEIVLPSTLVYIDDWYFGLFTDFFIESDSVALHEVTIPASVTYIGENAFNSQFCGDGSVYHYYEQFTIKGYSGTAAQEYAERNGINFVAIET